MVLKVELSTNSIMIIGKIKSLGAESSFLTDGLMVMSKDSCRVYIRIHQNSTKTNQWKILQKLIRKTLSKFNKNSWRNFEPEYHQKLIRECKIMHWATSLFGEKKWKFLLSSDGFLIHEIGLLIFHNYEHMSHSLFMRYKFLMKKLFEPEMIRVQFFSCDLWIHNS